MVRREISHLEHAEKKLETTVRGPMKDRGFCHPNVTIQSHLSSFYHLKRILPKWINHDWSCFYMETWNIRFFTINDGDVSSKWPQILGLWLSLVFCGEMAKPCSIEVGQLDRPHIVFVDFSVLVMSQGWKDPTWSNGWAETDLEEKALLGKQMQLQYVAVMPLDTDPLLLQGQRTSKSLVCLVSPGAVWVPALAEGCGAKVSCRGAKKRADDGWWHSKLSLSEIPSDVPWNSPETGSGNVAESRSSDFWNADCQCTGLPEWCFKPRPTLHGVKIRH
jgi:hypothetical protein